jgi:hypothetical protein
MSWDRKFIDYGIVAVEGQKVKVYSNPQFCINIDVGKDIQSAYWSGDSVIVVLENGETRQYTSYQFHQTL